jgi:hypothetical protein
MECLRIIYTDLNSLFCEVIKRANLQGGKVWEHMHRVTAATVTLGRERLCRSVYSLPQRRLTLPLSHPTLAPHSYH